MKNFSSTAVSSLTDKSHRVQSAIAQGKEMKYGGNDIK